MTAPCPRLTGDVATLRRLYTHLTKRDVRQMRAYHSCPDCPGTPPRPLLARDPKDDPR